MFWQSLGKVPTKVNERTAQSKTPFVIRISNRVHRRAILVTICTILVAIFGTIIVNSGSSRTFAYANSMRGIGVGIYWNQDCTNRTLSLDWGQIEPSSNSTVMVYVRNEGESAVSLWMTTSDWTPNVASNYMALSWNYTGRILSPHEVSPIELILNISPTVSGITDFSVDIVISATG